MILLIGLPKSGTTSFNALFTSLGYRTYHWRKGGDFIGTLIRGNKQNRRPLLEGFKPEDCITQMDVCVSEEHSYWPQVVDYERLYFENPQAVFILNKRDPQRILASFKKWSDYDQRLYRFNPELVETKTDDGFIRFVEDHYQKIEAFFAAHPNSKFISYDVETDRLEKLRRYIDIMNFDAFPHKNKGTALIDGSTTSSIFRSTPTIADTSSNARDLPTEGFHGLLKSIKQGASKRKKKKTKTMAMKSVQNETNRSESYSVEQTQPSHVGSTCVQSQSAYNQKLLTKRPAPMSLGSIVSVGMAAGTRGSPNAKNRKIHLPPDNGSQGNSLLVLSEKSPEIEASDQSMKGLTSG